MTPTLRDLLSQPEDQRLDFKQTELLDNHDAIAKHLVAFANRYGGRLVFGVTDDCQLEQADIDQESVSQTVRNVARDRCDPPVSFERRYHEAEELEGRIGDVFIVDIKPRSQVPHAVVGGGNNLTRKYYIRTADQSRPVTDSEELHHLFVDSPDPSFQILFPTAVVHHPKTYESVPLRPSIAGWRAYRSFFDDLDEDTREDIRDRESGQDEVGELTPIAEENFASRMIREAFPELLLNSFRHQPNDFWIREATSNPQERQYLQQSTEAVSLGDIEKRNAQSALDAVSIDVSGVYTYPGDLLLVPRGTNILAEFPSDDDAPAKLLFEKQNQLSMEVCIHQQRLSVFGTPSEYPGRIPSDPSISRRYTIELTAKFGFPNRKDPEIRRHQAFVKGFRKSLRDGWDLRQFDDRTPQRELYRIGERVDSIEERLGDVKGEK